MTWLGNTSLELGRKTVLRVILEFRAGRGYQVKMLGKTTRQG